VQQFVDIAESFGSDFEDPLNEHFSAQLQKLTDTVIE
jgi:hypothetical protein